ncbi:MAG: PEGA domain-containing protein [Bacteroidota bacterium]
MKKVILLTIILSIILTWVKLHGTATSNEVQPMPLKIKTGEDDDQPVFIQTTRKGNGLPIPGVTITLIEADTFIAQTNSMGIATLRVPHTGQYQLKIESPIYVDVNDVVNILSPQTTRVDTLLEE